MKTIIVVIAYNRIESTKRLLSSLLNADYSISNNRNIDLIVSIDNSVAQDDFFKEIIDYKWVNGTYKIMKQPENLGLRKHVLLCGDLVSDGYDNIILLEDDLVVSPNFYTYYFNTIEKYNNIDKIAGISLYTHKINLGSLDEFDPINIGFDVYLQKYAMSWGQCYSKRMWKKFKEFYLNNLGDSSFNNKSIPNYILNWNEKSWLKYYMLYMYENDLYFIYPYISLSTNQSEVGEHSKDITSDYMVPLLIGDKNYKLGDFKSLIKYDMFFELESLLITNLDREITENKVIVDLYGVKTNFDGDILISTKKYNYSVLQNIALKYRPIDMNLVNIENGIGIYIYDLRKHEKNIAKHSNILKLRYFNKGITIKKTLILLVNLIKTKITLLFKRNK